MRDKKKSKNTICLKNTYMFPLVVVAMKDSQQKHN